MNAEEPPELRSGWQRCWHGESRPSARKFIPWDMGKQPRDGVRVTLHNQKYKEGTKELGCLALAGWRQTIFPWDKAEEERTGGIIPHVFSKEQITSGRAEVTQAGTLQKEVGWAFTSTAIGQLNTAKGRRDELPPGGLHQHFPTRQALYSVKTNSGANKEKRKNDLVIMSNSLLNTM